MPTTDGVPSPDSIRLKDVFGVFVTSADDVEFRLGSLSGMACVVSDPQRRGLLGPVIQRLLARDAAQLRPWNQAEIELLEELLPQLQDSGVVEGDSRPSSPDFTPSPSIPGKDLADARVAIVGNGVLGEAVRTFLTRIPCRSVTVLESASVATDGRVPTKPREPSEWIEALREHDWIIAAQDCFEPQELAALNEWALKFAVPWSLVCFDGYEGWVGPTFVPGQTACFGCFQRRLFAGSTAPKHVFMDPRIKVHRVPSPWSIGPETAPWVSLIASIFALELVAASQGRSFTLNAMLIVHRLNLTFQRESVLQLPRCPDCSKRAGAPAVNVFSHLLSTRRNGE
jgi:bacteriocin biosynthesis cyclodehydratase domain-containing protein